MEWIAIALPIFLGAATVLQGGMNRQIASHWGLSGAVLLNSLVLLLLAGLLYYFSRSMGSRFPELSPPSNASAGSAGWWYWIPGFFGFCIVAGVPLAISRAGAVKFFLAFIGAQLLASLLWDAAIEGLPLNAYRLAGTAIAFAGAILVILKG